MSRMVESEEDKSLIKGTDVDESDHDSDVVESYWLQKRRRFITSILTVEVKGGIAHIDYRQNNITWDGKPEFKFGMPDEEIQVHKKENGKWVGQCDRQGQPVMVIQRGDLLCPCTFSIGNVPVLVVREKWGRTSGFPQHETKGFEIESYNGALALLDDANEVRGNTFMVQAALKRCGFRIKKGDDGEWFYYRE